MKVYVATHSRSDEELRSRKIIGIFSSKANAFTVVGVLAAGWEPLDSPDLFQVDVYDLDEAFFDTVSGRALSNAAQR